MFDKSKTYAAFNLIDLGLLPSDWDEQVKKVAEENAYLVKLDGKSSTSREPENSKGATVFVVEGNIIFDKLNWLHNLYENELLELANNNFNNSYEISKGIANSININLLKGINARYEWHVDTNPLTGILYVTDHNESDGGELIFKLPNETVTVHPKKGLFILFDAREILHSVQPLTHNSFRISIPMNYYLKGVEQKRPEDLDTYIYDRK